MTDKKRLTMPVNQTDSDPPDTAFEETWIVDAGDD